MNTQVASGAGVLQTLMAGLPPAAPVPASLAWLTALRAAAVERIGALKLPTRRDEAWRFTDLAALAQQSFGPLRTPTTLRPADIAAFRIDEAATRLVFVDGVHAPHLSSAGETAGAVVGTLAGAGARHGATLAPHLARHAGFQDQLFTALNTAFLHDAALVLVPRDTALAGPVHLLHVATQPGVASHPRTLLLAAEGCTLTLIEDYVALHDDASFTNAVTELALDAGAQLDHVRVQRESRAAFHVARCAVSLARSSRYHAVSVALGAQMSRLDLEVVQGGEGAECRLDGLALIGGSQLADTHTFIDHAQPRGVSRQLHKCIVDGAAHAVFNGRVMVRPGAQLTDSAQASRNLLLSGQALVDTLPQLEIFAADVKCTHGATVGQLDSDELFYLRSRGLSEAAARSLLTYAFGAEVVDRIAVASLRHALAQVLLRQTGRQP